MADPVPDDAQPARTGRFAWLRKASDRVPTKWFAAIGTTLFLAATAAFGGLATAAEPPLATIRPGDEHRNDQVAITVERALLIDELPAAGTRPDEGERVLVMQLRLENTWTRPVTLYPTSTVIASLSIAELDDQEPGAVARYDDTTRSPVLQPGVPVEVVLTWAVPAERFVAGDTLHITLSDMTLYTGSFVTTGQWWQDPKPAAELTVTLTDVGAGVGADEAGGDG